MIIKFTSRFLGQKGDFAKHKKTIWPNLRRLMCWTHWRIISPLGAKKIPCHFQRSLLTHPVANIANKTKIHWISWTGSVFWNHYSSDLLLVMEQTLRRAPCLWCTILQWRCHCTATKATLARVLISSLNTTKKLQGYTLEPNSSRLLSLGSKVR